MNKADKKTLLYKLADEFNLSLYPKCKHYGNVMFYSRIEVWHCLDCDLRWKNEKKNNNNGRL